MMIAAMPTKYAEVATHAEPPKMAPAIMPMNGTLAPQGMKVVVTGRIQTGSYVNKDGQKVYTTEVVVEDQEFAESKASSDSYAASHPRTEAAPAPSMPSPSAASADGFMNIPDGIDEELPFN